VFAVLEFQLQQFDRASNHAALQLHNASVKGGPAVHGGEETECSFAPYVCGLDGRAVLKNGQQRENRPSRKISVLEETAGLANDGAELKRDRPKMGIDPTAALRPQRSEQLIAQRIPARFGQSIIVGTGIHRLSSTPYLNGKSEQNRTLFGILITRVPETRS
jgi:hypothetical protein